MKKIIILIIVILILCGCKKRYDYTLEIYCDEQYGIEYIRDNGIYRGGISVRLDENGNVIHCKKGE